MTSEERMRRRAELLDRSKGCLWLTLFLYALTGVIAYFEPWLAIAPGFGSIAAYIMSHELLGAAYEDKP